MENVIINRLSSLKAIALHSVISSSKKMNLHAPRNGRLGMPEVVL